MKVRGDFVPSSLKGKEVIRACSAGRLTIAYREVIIFEHFTNNTR